MLSTTCASFTTTHMKGDADREDMADRLKSLRWECLPVGLLGPEQVSDGEGGETQETPLSDRK